MQGDDPEDKDGKENFSTTHLAMYTYTVMREA